MINMTSKGLKTITNPFIFLFNFTDLYITEISDVYNRSCKKSFFYEHLCKANHMQILVEATPCF